MEQIPSDLLSRFSGYLELGMFAEANDELEHLPHDLRSRPAVLLARLALLMEMKRWEDGALLGKSLCKLWPDESLFYIHTAYCLHELKQTKGARERLLNGPAILRSDPVFFYNLACYEAQLGNVVEAKHQLTICFQMDESYRSEALDDPDLEPIWDPNAFHSP